MFLPHHAQREQSGQVPLSKGKQQIPKEIPQGGDPHGKHFAEIEVPFQLAIEQIDCQRVQAHPHQRDTEILGIFHSNLRVAALKGPQTIENVIRGSRDDETEDIAQVFVPLQPFLADVGHTEVDDHPREAYHSEFQELQQKFPGEFYVKQQGIHSRFMKQQGINRQVSQSVLSYLDNL